MTFVAYPTPPFPPPKKEKNVRNQSYVCKVLVSERFCIKQSSKKFGRALDLSFMPCEADYHIIAWFIHNTNNPMQRTVLCDGNSALGASPSKIYSS